VSNLSFPLFSHTPPLLNVPLPCIPLLSTSTTDAVVFPFIPGADTSILRGSITRWTLLVAQALTRDHPPLTCAPRSLGLIRMLWCLGRLSMIGVLSSSKLCGSSIHYVVTVSAHFTRCYIALIPPTGCIHFPFVVHQRSLMKYVYVQFFLDVYRN
jgi:hypothetical protein